MCFRMAYTLRKSVCEETAFEWGICSMVRYCIVPSSKRATGFAQRRMHDSEIWGSDCSAQNSEYSWGGSASGEQNSSFHDSLKYRDAHQNIMKKTRAKPPTCLQLLFIAYCLCILVKRRNGRRIFRSPYTGSGLSHSLYLGGIAAHMGRTERSFPTAFSGSLPRR